MISIDALLKNQEMKCSSSKKSILHSRIPSSLDISIWHSKMTRLLWHWVWVLLHEPTASLSPAFHFETYQKKNWQRGWYYCKFNSGEIITKLHTLPLLWAYRSSTKCTLHHLGIGISRESHFSLTKSPELCKKLITKSRGLLFRLIIKPMTSLCLCC